MLFSSNLPRWLQVLLTEAFFNACIIHQEAKKNEKNIYCLDCCISICPHCLSPHSSHRLLQIRRYVYHDVIRLDDATKLMDYAFVQPLLSLSLSLVNITNSAKVIFINQRPQTRQFRGSGNFCSTCDRSLQDPYLFCSLSCKNRRRAFQVPVECNFLSLHDAGLDDGLVTPDSVLEPSGSTKTSSGSGGYSEVWCGVLACTATTEIVRKKRSNLTICRPTCPPYPKFWEV
ncbi:hypothetical protein CRYUN_Cryun23aG0152400 [Craigia yunnanensis]